MHVQVPAKDVRAHGGLTPLLYVPAQQYKAHERSRESIELAFDAILQKKYKLRHKYGFRPPVTGRKTDLAGDEEVCSCSIIGEFIWCHRCDVVMYQQCLSRSSLSPEQLGTCATCYSFQACCSHLWCLCAAAEAGAALKGALDSYSCLKAGEETSRSASSRNSRGLVTLSVSCPRRG